LARHAILALTAALALLATGCPASTGEFRREDFSKPNRWPGSSIVVGQNVVVRLGSWSFRGIDPSADPFVDLYVDLFPVGAVLRGARVQVIRHGQVYGGPARVLPQRSGQGYDVLGPYHLDPADREERPGPDSTTVWLDPVCMDGACETVVVHDGDWPPVAPPY
jgi:hypothetical protein